MLTFEQALAEVRTRIEVAQPQPALETVPLTAARGRILAEDLAADRDYPPFHRSTRDGFAVHAADVDRVPAALDVVGLARAGDPFAGSVAPGSAIEIMTGAPLPEGTDAVVMIEYTREAAAAGEGTARRVEILRSVTAFENVVCRGSEARAGSRVLPRGRRIGPGEIGLAASIGRAKLKVFVRPRVAILPTGDEVVPLNQPPAWFQIRNSNAMALAAQVEAAGGVPCLLGVAPDTREGLRRLIEEGLECDLLVLSGGISVGKYDFVAEVLAELGAETCFQGVAIRPGKPLTFGRVHERFFFALPGNPVSTFVTFELFARPALAVLGGGRFEPPVFLRARLRKPVRQKTGLSVFMPARVERNGAVDALRQPGAESGHACDPPQGEPWVELVGWHGSGDLVGLAEANCFLVIHPHQADLAAGEWVDVLPKSW
ncbi:MAG TPA: gephyrin-like molybdotransferase Glp [Terriglobia bacterium]|nr:gephyrin-like molybdotransferase Glp [Terriglobia bacterium]